MSYDGGRWSCYLLTSFVFQLQARHWQKVGFHLTLSYRANRQPAEQSELLLQTPLLLNSLLNVSTSRNWLTPTLGAMRLHAYITQALYPGQESLKFAQLPGIKQSEAEDFAKEFDGYEDLAASLEEKHDGRLEDVKKAISRWGKLDLVDASFKGISSC